MLNKYRSEQSSLSKEALLQKYSVRKQTDDSYVDSSPAAKQKVRRASGERTGGRGSEGQRRSRDFKIHVAPSIPTQHVYQNMSQQKSTLRGNSYESQ